MHPCKSTSSEPECLKSKYKVGKVIGTGKFSVVKDCLELSTKKKYALKIVKKVTAKEDYEAIKNEVVMLNAINHPNIISLYEEVFHNNIHFLVLEFANSGDLFELISEQGSFSEHDVSHMISDVICGINYLHSLNICHRDIKPENIMVHRLGLSRAYHSYSDLSNLGDICSSSNFLEKSQNIHNAHMNDLPNFNQGGFNDAEEFSQCHYSINNDIVLKIADFGLATYVSEPLYTMCGTPTYVAPEVISETGYGLKVDVWSAGVLAYILFTGFPPFDSEIDDQEDLFESIVRNEADLSMVEWEGIGDEAKQLVASMLSKNPEVRPTAHEIYHHPWVKKYRDSLEDASKWNKDKFSSESLEKENGCSNQTLSQQETFCAIKPLESNLTSNFPEASDLELVKKHKGYFDLSIGENDKLLVADIESLVINKDNAFMPRDNLESNNCSETFDVVTINGDEKKCTKNHDITSDHKEDKSITNNGNDGYVEMNDASIFNINHGCNVKASCWNDIACNDAFSFSENESTENNIDKLNREIDDFNGTYNACDSEYDEDKETMYCGESLYENCTVNRKKEFIDLKFSADCLMEVCTEEDIVWFDAEGGNDYNLFENNTSKAIININDSFVNSIGSNDSYVNNETNNGDYVKNINNNNPYINGISRLGSNQDGSHMAICHTQT